MKLEICANSFQSAKNAQETGAHRIELCSELAIGGITPSYGLLKKVMHELTIPVFVLVRPRSGNFTYSEDEFQIMKENIQLCKELGCAGIVSGILHEDNTLDVQRTQELIEFAKPLSFTFHRAFDWIPNPLEAIEQLIKIGTDRILTSGQESSAEKGIPLLKKLQQQSEGKMIILPGGGINEENAVLFKQQNFKEIHCSLTKIYQIGNASKIPMNSQKHFNENAIAVSDKTKITNTLKNINNEA